MVFGGELGEVGIYVAIDQGDNATVRLELDVNDIRSFPMAIWGPTSRLKSAGHRVVAGAHANPDADDGLCLTAGGSSIVVGIELDLLRESCGPAV